MSILAFIGSCPPSFHSSVASESFSSTGCWTKPLVGTRGHHVRKSMLSFSCCLVQLFGDPINCSPPDSSVCGILQARILEWVGIPFSRGSSQPRDWTQVFCRSPALLVDSLPAEPQGKLKNTGVGSLSLLQRIFLTQELNWGLLHCRWILYQLSYQGSPLNKEGDNIQPCHTPFPILSELEYRLILFGEAV